MKKWVELAYRLKSERGVVAIIVAISMVMFIGFTALAVDVGYLMVTRNELQNVADAAALAATRKLGVIYEGMSYEEQQAYTCDPLLLTAIANDVALQNQAGGSNIAINGADVVIGQWDGENKELEPTLNRPDAVRVTARRDGRANGPITTFFAGVLGINTSDVTAFATAALTGQSTSGPGGLPIPVGISKAWFQQGFCDQPIKFYPTGTIDGCAGWHTYDISPPSAAQLRDILTQLENGTYQSPDTEAGETQFEFTGGTVAAAFEEMKSLFDAMKGLNDGVIDADNDPNTWTTSVVVYDWDDCSNPNKVVTIAGYATVTIYEVSEAPEKTIWAVAKCEDTEPGRGGGGNFGTMGSIPGLVEPFE